MAMFTILYLIFLVLSISFFDSAIPLDYRLLSPVRFSFVPLVCFATNRFMLGLKTPNIAKVFLAGGFLIFFLLSVLHGYEVLFEEVMPRRSYTSHEWKTSPTIAAVRSLLSSNIIVTNEPFAVDFLTEHKSILIPWRIDPTTREPDPGFEKKMAWIRELTMERPVVVVFFDKGFNKEISVPENEFIRTFNVELISTLSDGRLYRSSHP
jgi:hypothetical protein